MKKLLIRVLILVTVSFLILLFPVKLCADSINRYVQYNKLCNLPYFNLGENSETEQFTVFYGNDAQSNAHNYRESIKVVPEVKSVHVFNNNTNLITYLYTDVDDLKYKTIVEQVSGRGGTAINYRKLVVENAEGYEVSNSGTTWDDKVLNIGSYEIPEMFIKSDYLKCKEGRYPDFDFKYKNGDTVEIMVTDGLGLNTGDTCFISLDALDKNDELVVVKAKVVGIASKGVFLPYYERYFSGDATTVNEAYNRVFNGEMIYYPNLSDFYIYNSHFRPEEKDVDDRTTVAMTLVEENAVLEISEIAKKYDGTLASQRTGLFTSSKNIYSFRSFVNYEDVSYFESLSIAQTEFYCVISLIVFMVIFIISVITKIIRMLVKYKNENTLQGDC